MKNYVTLLAALPISSQELLAESEVDRSLIGGICLVNHSLSERCDTYQGSLKFLVGASPS
jgi:hypothetical protein